MTGPDLLAELLKCHEVRIRRQRPRGHADQVLTVRLVGERWRRLNMRQRSGETGEALLWRALSELRRREIEGMPKPDLKAQARRSRQKLITVIGEQYAGKVM